MISTTERINIKGLLVENPEKEDLYFDPEEEITESEFKSMLNWLVANKATQVVDLYSNGAYRIAALFPTRKSALNLDSESKKIVSSYVASTLSGWENLRALQNLKVLFPEGLESLVVNASQQNVNDSIRDLREQEWNGEMVLAAASLKIAYPKRFEEVGLEDEDFPWLRKQFEGYFVSDTLWSSMRILFPNEHKYQFQPRAQQERLKRSIENDRKFAPTWGWERYLARAYDLHILAADRVEVTEEGLKVTPRQVEFKDEPLQMPEARKF